MLGMTSKIRRRVVTGVQGVSGAGQMSALSTVSHVSGVGATSAASKMVNKLAERATTRQNAPVEETTIATPADFKRMLIVSVIR